MWYDQPSASHVGGVSFDPEMSIAHGPVHSHEREGSTKLWGGIGPRVEDDPKRSDQPYLSVGKSRLDHRNMDTRSFSHVSTHTAWPWPGAGVAPLTLRSLEPAPAPLPTALRILTGLLTEMGKPAQEVESCQAQVL